MVSFSSLAALLATVVCVSSSIIRTLGQERESPNGLTIRTTNEFQNVACLLIGLALLN